MAEPADIAPVVAPKRRAVLAVGLALALAGFSTSGLRAEEHGAPPDREVGGDKPVKLAKPVPKPEEAKGTEVEQYCANIADAAADARFAWQAQTLTDLSKELDGKIAALEAKRAEYEAWLKRREEFLAKVEEGVVEIYSKMRPEAAATQLASMKDEAAAALLAKLSTRVASAILNEMDPVRGARLTNTISGMTAPEDKDQEPMKQRWLALLLLLAAGGCSQTAQEIGREPTMAPVGSGLSSYRDPVPAVFPAPIRPGYHSLWNDSRADLYRDPRAMQVGDVVRVDISIDDEATLDNRSNRSRDSEADAKVGIGFSRDTVGFGLDANADVASRSSSKGQGSIDRSEKIRLSIAAVVTEALPNGNLLISGSQEVRVNFELRVLNIAGIVRPRDISRNNTISYDKIAEARISYGGRGRVTEVQQPSYGQQIYDKLTPF